MNPICSILVSLTVSVSLAQERSAPQEVSTNVPQEESTNEVRFTPYAWLTGYRGSIGARGINFDFDLNFFDVLETSDTIMGLMGAVDLKVGPAVFQLNGAYATAERENTRGVAFGNGGVSASATVDAKVSSTWLELLGGYRAIEHSLPAGHTFSLDALVGVRQTLLDLDLDVRADAAVTLPSGEELTVGTSRTLDRDQDWFEPFLGARAMMELHEDWVLSLRGDVGGFDVDGSEMAWQLIGAAGREWSFDGGTFALFVGYRALHQDYESDGFEWDVTTHGPLLGCSVKFVF